MEAGRVYCAVRTGFLNINEVKLIFMPGHDSGSESLSWHHGGPVSVAGHSVWDLWCTEWNSDGFISEHFGFPLCISLSVSCYPYYEELARAGNIQTKLDIGDNCK
jgi:hypothetical protein